MVWCRNISRGRLFLVVIRRLGVGFGCRRVVSTMRQMKEEDSCM